jgi:hypothetical protein
MSQAVGSNVDGFTGQFKPYGGYGSGTNQPVSPKDFAPKNQNDEYARLQMENSRAKAIEDYQKQMQQNNAKEPIFYILVTAGVLVAGYFAYKKFKK